MSFKLPVSYFIIPTLLLFLSACAPVEKIKTEKKQQNVTDVVAIKSPVKKSPELNVAILLSGPVAAFKNTSRILINQLNKNTTTEYILSGDINKDTDLIKTIALSDHTHVVALGLKAAKAVSSLKSKHVIFSHVFNYKEHKLINGRFKGVSALPAPDQLFKDWKALSPGLTSVVLLTGDGYEKYVERAIKIAAVYGIELVHHIVKSDKEFVYIAKRLPSYIQGHWIFPDNRVLSRAALKDVMSYNSKKGKQSLVFNKGLLSFGGLFYVNISDKETARLIIKRLKASLGKSAIPGKGVLMVAKHDLGINKKISSQLGLVIPEHYRQFLKD